VKRLPVVDEAGLLVGIVSRADLLAAFDRTDEQIADKVRSIARKVLRSDLADLTIDVREGRVMLDGSVGFTSQRDVLIDVIGHIPGVLEIDDRLEVAASEGSAGIPFAPIQPPGEELGPRADL
jgi:CBS domain-containing protein